MKRVKFLICLLLSLTVMLTAFGCSDDRDYVPEDVGDETSVDEDGNIIIGSSDVKGTLKIRLWEGGFGDEWLTSVIADFSTAYPNVTVDLRATVERTVAYGELLAGEGNQKYDLYFTESVLYDKAISNLEPLDDVYSYKWVDEEQTIYDKISTQFSDLYQLNDGHRYMISSYISWYGFTYNSDYISDEEVPNTTDELLALCASLKSSSITPLIFSGETDYWNQIYCDWFAQYEGLEAFNQMQLGRVKDTDGTYKTDVSSTYLTGSLRSMEVCQSLLWYPDGYIYPTSVGEQFISAQKKFLDGNAAIMANGAWMLNEMDELYPNGLDFQLKAMKQPVISSVIEKCSSIADDAELSALIDAIDAGETTLSGTGYSVTEEDFNRISEARSLCYIGGEQASAVIPAAAQNKNLAKLFLRFFYRDKSILKHAASDVGVILPIVDFDYSTVLAKGDRFRNQTIELLQNSQPFSRNWKDFALTPYIYPEGAKIEQCFGSRSANDRKTAEQLYLAHKAKYTANDNAAYRMAMQAAGLALD